MNELLKNRGLTAISALSILLVLSVIGNVWQMVRNSDLIKKNDEFKNELVSKNEAIVKCEKRFSADEITLISRIRDVKFQNEEAKRLKREIEERDKLRKEAIQKAKTYSKNWEDIIVSLVSTWTGTSK